jgi:hypothetical protein
VGLNLDGKHPKKKTPLDFPNLCLLVDPYLAEEKVHINFLLATLDLRKTMDMPFIEKKTYGFYFGYALHCIYA